MGHLPRYHSHITRSSTLTTMQAFRTSLAASTRRAFVAPRAPIAASFSTSARFQKDAIEPAEKAADAVKSAAGVASNKTSEAANVASQKANEAKADVNAETRGGSKTLGETVGEAVEDASYDAEAAKNIGAKKVNQAARDVKKAVS